MSPVPPATIPLPPATPTPVTATHVAMRTDHHRSHRLSRLRCSRRDTKTGDSNDGAGQDICQDVAATYYSHCVCSVSSRARLLRRETLTALPHRIFALRPVSLIAPFLEIGLRPLR